MEKVDIIKIKARMADKDGKLIPRGVLELLSIEIADQVAVFHFKDGKTTERWAKLAMALEKERGADDTRYIPRLQKAITKYPAKKKEEIRDLILKKLEQLGGKIL
ncbi:MAG: hypothetical protein FJZ63_02120 [Chlamydiae bacterium]|nr:hypothetical protein [Chlamydiota bacterium]